MLDQAKKLLAQLVVAASLATGCGADIDDAELLSPPAHETCEVRVREGIPDEMIRAAHGRAKAVGAIQGKLKATEYVSARTADGYRLRRVISTVVMALTLFLVGSLLGALLLGLLGKRPAIQYAQRLGAAVEREIAAIRALGGGDGALAGLVGQLADALDATERRAEHLIDLAVPLERERDSDDAIARRAELYANVEELAGGLEHLHLRAVSWQERLADEDAELLAEEAAAAAESLHERLGGMA